MGMHGILLLHRNVQQFRGGLVFKAHRLVYHSTLGLRVTKKKKKKEGTLPATRCATHALRTGCSFADVLEWSRQSADVLDSHLPVLDSHLPD